MSKQPDTIHNASVIAVNKLSENYLVEIRRDEIKFEGGRQKNYEFEVKRRISVYDALRKVSTYLIGGITFAPQNSSSKST